MELLSKSYKELLSDCSCPVCQEVFVNPQRLIACRHTLCRKCIEKMNQQSVAEEPQVDLDPLGLFGGLFGNPMMGQASRARNSSTNKAALRCPICREKIDSFEPDEAVVSLVQVLRLLRTDRCRHAPEECWSQGTLLCPCCDKRFCQQHYEVQMAAVREAGDDLCKDIRTLLSRDGANAAELAQLQGALEAAAEHQAILLATLQQGMEDFCRQVEAARLELQTPVVSDQAIRAALEGDLVAALLELERGDLVGLARLLPGATERLVAAQRAFPQRHLSLQFQPADLTAGLSSLMLRVSASTYQAPYKRLPSVLNSVHTAGLTQKPWDLGLLTNLDGVYCIKGSLRLISEADADATSNASKLSGPLLVINAQHFPTKMLHVTDMNVQQVATITPEFGPEGMPGRIHIYNERQLIMASDAGRHKVFVFNIEGRLLTSFGEKGDQVGQFRAPMGISASNGHMFVVDSKNKRIQVFDIDNGYICIAAIQHSGFSEGINSVLANSNSVFVVDRNESNLFIFDRETRMAVNEKVTLDGKPFDIVPDEFGNAFVTLVDAGKVQIVRRSGALKTIGFKDSHHSGTGAPQVSFPMLPMMSSAASQRMFHGAAYDQTKRRLYIADLMRSCVIVANL